VERQVLGEILPPGVQDGGDAEVAAEMPWIASEGHERLGAGLEEEAIEGAGVALRERVQGVRQQGGDDAARAEGETRAG
jgi:hypothetical protein